MMSVPAIDEAPLLSIACSDPSWPQLPPFQCCLAHGYLHSKRCTSLLPNKLHDFLRPRTWQKKMVVIKDHSLGAEDTTSHDQSGS